MLKPPGTKAVSIAPLVPPRVSERVIQAAREIRGFLGLSFWTADFSDGADEHDAGVTKENRAENAVFR
jgi:hypothetical protein